MVTANQNQRTRPKKQDETDNQASSDFFDSPQPIEATRVETTALEAIERASIDMQIATAKRYPIHSAGQLSKVKDEIMTFATLDEETAAGCFYTLPRGGKTIQGGSVRLAEIALSCYGNSRVLCRVIEVDTFSDNPHVLVQAVGHDLEKNVATSLEKRRRITKKKNKERIDEDDINLAVNSCTSIAFRDVVFKVVPLALVKPAYEAAKKVSVGEIKSLAIKRGQVLARLKQMGVTEDRILAVVECRKVEDIDMDKLGTLIGLGTALKDGDTTLEEAFPPIGFKDKSKTEQANIKEAAGSKKVDASKIDEAPAGDQPANDDSW